MFVAGWAQSREGTSPLVETQYQAANKMPSVKAVMPHLANGKRCHLAGRFCRERGS